MKSIHSIIDDLGTKTIEDLSEAARKVDAARDAQREALELADQLIDLINSKDRAPKKKLKPVIKQLQTKLLDIEDNTDDSFAAMENTEESQGELLEASIERLNEIDALYNDYKHYKKINIEHFLNELDKLIY